MVVTTGCQRMYVPKEMMLYCEKLQDFKFRSDIVFLSNTIDIIYSKLILIRIRSQLHPRINKRKHILMLFKQFRQALGKCFITI